MDTNWKHQKDAITTDQKNRVDDERVHEADKRHLKENESNPAPIAKPSVSKARGKPKKT